MQTRRPILRRLALRAALFSLLASPLAQAQVLAPPANQMGSINYTSTAVPDNGGLWDPVWAAEQMQCAFEHEANITATAVTAVNNALSNTSNIQSTANDALNSAVSSYNNSVAVYNMVNNANSTISANAATTQNAYASSSAAVATANTAYNTVVNYTPSGAAASPHVLTGFSGSCSSATAIYTDGTTQSIGQVC